MSLAIVTGASRGIGRTIAIRLAGLGHTVACIARSRGLLDDLAAAHSSCLPLPLDLTDEHQVREAVGALLEEHGPCAILINNAGMGLRAAVEELPLDGFRRQMDINVFSCLQMMQLVLPGMRAAHAGLIVNISSVSGRIATPFHGGYSATKFALEALSDALRVEVQPFGVRVVLIEPGPVGTDFGATAAAESGGLLTDSTSPYASQYRAYLRSNERAHAQEWTPDAVADVVLRAVHSPSPSHRYGAYNIKYGAAIQVRKLSSWLLDRILTRNMRLDDDT